MAITAQKFIPKYKKENPKISFKSYTTLNSLDDESLKSKKSSNIISSESVETLGEIRVGLVSIAEVIKKDFGDKKKEAEVKRKEKLKKKRDKIKKEFMDSAKDFAGNAGKIIPSKVKGMWSNIVRFFSTILLGWIGLKLLEWGPKLVGILGPLASAADFVIDVGIGLVDALGTFLKFGEDMYKGLEVLTGKLFGQEGVEKLNQLTTWLTRVINLTVIAALISMQSNMLGGILGFGKGGIFRRGLSRALPRFFIRNFKGMGGRTLAKWLLGGGAGAGTTKAIAGGAATTTATVGAGGAGGATTATGGGAGTSGGLLGMAKIGAIILGASGLSTLIGEAGGQLVKSQSTVNKGTKKWKENFEDKAWYDPRKWGSWLLWRYSQMQANITAGIVSLFDILGTPFRLLIEAVRWPFLSDFQKDEATKNLEKFDARLREQIRLFLNMFDFLGVIGDNPGDLGAMDWSKGTSGTDELGYTGVIADEEKQNLEEENLKKEENNNKWYQNPYLPWNWKSNPSGMSGTPQGGGQYVNPKSGGVRNVEPGSFEIGGIVGKNMMAYLHQGEIVVDADSADGSAKDMLLAINDASTHDGIVEAIRNYAPYEALNEPLIIVTQQPSSPSQKDSTPQQAGKVMALPVHGSGDSIISFGDAEILYKK